MAAKKKPAITGLHSQGIVDDIFKSAGKAVVKEVRRDVRKVNKSYQRTTGTMTGAGKIGDGLGLKPHVKGAVGKSNWSNPKYREMDALEEKVNSAFIKQMGGRKKAGASAANKAMFEEFDSVEKRAIKRAAARKSIAPAKKAPVKKAAPKKK